MSTFGLELATDFTGARTPLNHCTCIDGSPLQHDVCAMLPDQRCVHFWGKCHNWSFDEGCPKTCFLQRGLHGGLFHVFIGKVVPFSSCTNCQHMPALVCVHLIGARDRQLSKLQ